MCPGAESAEFPGAVQPGYGKVQYRHVRLQGLSQPDGLLAVRRLAHHDKRLASGRQAGEVWRAEGETPGGARGARGIPGGG